MLEKNILYMRITSYEEINWKAQKHFSFVKSNAQENTPCISDSKILADILNQFIQEAHNHPNQIPHISTLPKTVPPNFWPISSHKAARPNSILARLLKGIAYNGKISSGYVPTINYQFQK